MQRFPRLGMLVVTIVALFVLMPLTGSAHEHQMVLDDQYELTVGFLAEPAFVGEQNGLSLRVDSVNGDEREPVLGLIESLEAEVICGDETMALELSSVFNDPGHYRAVFFPMAEGDYTFRITGEIEGNAIDESFTSAPDGFDSVQPREPLEFPKAA